MKSLLIVCLLLFIVIALMKENPNYYNEKMYKTVMGLIAFISVTFCYTLVT